MSQTVYMPGKKDAPKVRVEDAETKDLKYWLGRLEKDLEKDPNKQYADRDRARVAAMKAELSKREGGGGQAPSNGNGRQQAPQQSTAITRGAPGTIVQEGAFRDAHRATQALRNASASAHLVAPAPVCGTLPEGTELALSAIMVDVEHETYQIADKHGLAKSALDKIASAAGVSWDIGQTGRLDDGSDPHYAHYRAVGAVKNFDGSQRAISGEVEIDARDGSPQIEEIHRKAERGGRDPDRQILELRKFLLRHAESKAKNRAIRSLGVRTSYDRDELNKPFAVARLVFTGRTDDPAARARFQDKIADSFLGSSQALYGGAPPPAHARPAPAALPQHHAPPPVGAIGTDDEVYDAEYDSAPEHDPPAPAAAPQQQTTQAQAAGAAQGQQTLVGDGYDDRGDDPDNY